MSLTLYPNPAGITTNVGTTLLAAWLAGGAISRTGPGSAFTDTTDSAANIASALAYMQGGASWYCQYINYSGQTATIAAGAGVTLAGRSAAIPNNAMALLQIYVTPAGAVTITILSRQTIQ